MKAIVQKVTLVPRVSVGSVTIGGTQAGNTTMIAATPSKLYVNPQNTEVLTLISVVDTVTGIPWGASGSISGSLVDSLGNPVTEFSLVPIPYIPGTQGVFQVSLGDTSFLPNIGTGFTLILDGNQGGVVLHLEIPVEVQARYN